MGDLSKLDVLSIGHNGKSLTFPKELKSWAKIREFRLRFNHDPEQKIYRFIFRRGGFGISDHTITLEELQAINKPNSSLRDPRLMNDLERELFNLKKKGEFILFEKQKALMEAQQLFFEREKLLIDLQNTNSLLEAKMEAKILQRAVLEAIKKNRVNNDPTPDKNT